MKVCFSCSLIQGARNPQCIAVSPTDSHLATGDESGVVNMYSASFSSSFMDTGLHIKPQLKRQIDNLTTRIQQVGFSNDGQLMAMISSVKKDQLRLVHVETGRTYANWPTLNTPLSHLQCFAFSPNNSYLALGNDKGKVLLYQLLKQ
jgi:U3 small nucleolar RNA-associated protein 18